MKVILIPDGICPDKFQELNYHHPRRVGISKLSLSHQVHTTTSWFVDYGVASLYMNFINGYSS